MFAIYAFAKTANNSVMKDLQTIQRAWLAQKLDAAPRGVRTALAKHLGVRPDAITRMTNDEGEMRDISTAELVGMAEFFKSEPPGLSAARAAAGRQKVERSDPKVVRVPLLDTVTAGWLAAPMSQIPVEDVPLLAFADLGRGDFFALTVDGTSMDRLSPEGSVIVVNRDDKNLVSGKCYVFNYRGKTTFKRWQAGDPSYLAPFSTDPSHQPIFIKKKTDMEVIGRVRRTLLDL